MATCEDNVASSSGRTSLSDDDTDAITESTICTALDSIADANVDGETGLSMLGDISDESSSLISGTVMKISRPSMPLLLRLRSKMPL